jgi:hypothetical protein
VGRGGGRVGEVLAVATCSEDRCRVIKHGHFFRFLFLSSCTVRRGDTVKPICEVEKEKRRGAEGEGEDGLLETEDGYVCERVAS